MICPLYAFCVSHLFLIYFRFTQPRLLFQTSSNYNIPELDYLYLNTSPEEWEHFMNSLGSSDRNKTSLSSSSSKSSQASAPPLSLVNNNWINIGKDLVFYSKLENLTSFDQYDWLITENSQ
jgi:hypothetical protein